MNVSLLFFATLFFSVLYLVVPDAVVIDPFKFRDVQTDELIDGFLVFCFTWFATLAGGRLVGLTRTNRMRLSVQTNKDKSFEKTIGLEGRLAINLIFLIITSYTIFKIFLNADNIGDSGIIERSFIDKSSQYILVVLGVFAYGSMLVSGTHFKMLIEVMVFLISLLIAIVDMSREALIPLAFMFAYYLDAGRNRWKLMSWSIAATTILALLMLRRDFSLEDALDQPIFVVVKYLFESVSYVTAFNFLHFVQVLSEEGKDFTWHYLIMSIIPLPSSVIGAEILEGRNFDAFRPYGAAADLSSLSFGVLFVYWASFGWLAKLSSYSWSCVRITSSILAVMIYITSFQYPLRTSSKFFIIWILLLLIEKIFQRRSRC